VKSKGGERIIRKSARYYEAQKGRNTFDGVRFTSAWRQNEAPSAGCRSGLLIDPPVCHAPRTTNAIALS